MTLMQVLRHERSALGSLAALAFVLRLSLVVLGTALSPHTAVADGLVSLCQPSGQENSIPAAHDPAICQCGPICVHGCALGPSLASTNAVPSVRLPLPTVAFAYGEPIAVVAAIDGNKSIRAPPYPLI
ncbi:MAG: hypothetical protein ABJQ71_16705 [Roseibium sp.]